MTDKTKFLPHVNAGCKFESVDKPDFPPQPTYAIFRQAYQALANQSFFRNSASLLRYVEDWVL